MQFHKSLKEHIQAAFAGIWIQTFEPDECQKDISALCVDRNWKIQCWDIAQGFHNTGACVGDPMAPLKALPTFGNDVLLLLHNYHMFLQSPIVRQELINKIHDGKQNRAFVLVISPVIQIPIELQKLFVIIEHDLPTQDQLTQIATDLTADTTWTTQSTAVKSAAGLTRYEAEGAFALSLIRHTEIQSEEIWSHKAQILKKSGILTLHTPTEGLDSLGGLTALKDFCTRAITNGTSKLNARGAMLLGVPGTGKSQFAKALGKDCQRPTLTLDIGSAYASLVGETEERIRHGLKIVDAMAPAILFIDEVEKGLSGLGGQGDSGVASRLFGTFLTWLSDHTSDVFVIATSNDISKLPPEFTRAERWDAVWFLDLPEREQKDSIWQMYQASYNVGPPDRPVALIHDENWTGAEIKACCRLAALMDIPINQAARYVIPVATTNPEKVSALRDWAENRTLDADTGSLFRINKSPNGTRRNIFTKETI